MIRNIKRIVAVRRYFSSDTLKNITHTTIAGRKRFYKTVDCKESINNNGFYSIYLDKSVLKTPAKGDLELPNKMLAMIIAAEWDAQNSRMGIQPTSMPFMMLASTALDQVLIDRDHVTKTCLSYLPTDTSLFFTAEEDRILLERQRKHFLPLIEWVNSAANVKLEISCDEVFKLAHSEDTLKKFEGIINSMDHFTLACLQCLTMECKSLIMAIAVLCGRLSVNDAITMSRLEEEMQCEIWGVVEGGHDLDRLHNKIRISSASLFFSLLGKTIKLKN